ATAPGARSISRFARQCRANCSPIVGVNERSKKCGHQMERVIAIETRGGIAGGESTLAAASAATVAAKSVVAVFLRFRNGRWRWRGSWRGCALFLLFGLRRFGPLLDDAIERAFETLQAHIRLAIVVAGRLERGRRHRRRIGREDDVTIANAPCA